MKVPLHAADFPPFFIFPTSKVQTFFKNFTYPSATRALLSSFPLLWSRLRKFLSSFFPSEELSTLLCHFSLLSKVMDPLLTPSCKNPSFFFFHFHVPENDDDFLQRFFPVFFPQVGEN